MIIIMVIRLNSYCLEFIVPIALTLTLIGQIFFRAKVVIFGGVHFLLKSLQTYIYYYYTMQFLIAILIVVCLSQMAEGFMASFKRPSFVITQIPETASTSLFSCRRNNKIEKRKRNRDYARKFQSKVCSRSYVILHCNVYYVFLNVLF